MLLFVLALCVPSYGDTAVLVYKVTITDKPVMVDANFNTALVNFITAGSVKTSASFKGYLVFDVNTTTLLTNAPGGDANLTPTLVLVGTNPQTGAKKAQWVLQDTGGNVYIERLKTTAEKKEKHYGSLHFSGDGVPDANFYAWGRAWGSLAATALTKGGAKVEVPKSLKGQGGFEDWISDDVVPFTTGDQPTVTLTLDTAKTKKAAGLTVAAVVATLK